MRLAIFGGTFDPIHKAHVAMASEATNQFQLDRVLFVPAANPPHKSGLTFAAYPDRLRMVELAASSDPRFQVSRLEEGPECSYSIDTVERLRATLNPADELFFLIGADAFAEIESWYRWRELVQLVTFLVVSRPGHRYRIPQGARVERLETVDLPVSSSEIRSALAAGKRPAEIPEPVIEYIVQHGLYSVPVRA